MIHESIDIWRYLSARMVKIIYDSFVEIFSHSSFGLNSLVNSKHFIIQMIGDWGEIRLLVFSLPLDKKKRSFIHVGNSFDLINQREKTTIGFVEMFIEYQIDCDEQCFIE